MEGGGGASICLFGRGCTTTAPTKFVNLFDEREKAKVGNEDYGSILVVLCGGDEKRYACSNYRGGFE